jgi:glycosyltransferase involved in cell wall biosynthesis
MRVLQVSPFFSPQMGGSARVVYQASKHLADRGHRVSVVSGDYGTNHAQFSAFGEFQPIIFPSVVSKWGFYLTPGLVGWIQKNIANYEIIHLNEFRTFQNIVVQYYSIIKGIPYVLSAHGTLPIIMQRKLAKRLYDYWFGRSILLHSSRLIAVSQAELQEYKTTRLPMDRIRVVHNGLDLSEYFALPDKGTFRHKFGIPRGTTKAILYTGRLHKQKGLVYLLAAFSELRLQGREYVLVIVGPDEGELVRLKNLATRLRIQDNVLIVGPLYGSDKLAAMVDADVLVYPAYHEIFGLVPLEALMCGTPVVVCEGCGMGELIGEAGAGYLVPFGNPTALASALGRAIDYQDEAQEKVNKGQLFIREHLDWKKVILQLENLYLEVIHR